MDSIGPKPKPTPKGTSSVSYSSDVRAEAAFHSPRVTRDDLLNIAHKMRYDLEACRAKLTDLQSWIVALDLPTAEQSVNEKTLLALALNTHHEYTERSLRDELAVRGADPEMVDRIMARCAG